MSVIDTTPMRCPWLSTTGAPEISRSTRYRASSSVVISSATVMMSGFIRSFTFRVLPIAQSSRFSLLARPPAKRQQQCQAPSCASDISERARSSADFAESGGQPSRRPPVRVPPRSFPARCEKSPELGGTCTRVQRRTNSGGLPSARRAVGLFGIASVTFVLVALASALVIALREPWMRVAVRGIDPRHQDRSFVGSPSSGTSW
jgi:hypothetical protein